MSCGIFLPHPASSVTRIIVDMGTCIGIISDNTEKKIEKKASNNRTTIQKTLKDGTPRIWRNCLQKTNDRLLHTFSDYVKSHNQIDDTDKAFMLNMYNSAKKAIEDNRIVHYGQLIDEYADMIRLNYQQTKRYYDGLLIDIRKAITHKNK